MIVLIPDNNNDTNTNSATNTNNTNTNNDQPKRKEIPEGMDQVMKMIEEQVTKYPIMLYMKGTPRQPQCGFSGQTVRLLNAVGADFSSVNVLEFPAIRDGIKVYSDWPTIPQLYVNGEFIGGCDILTQMYNDGELEKLLKEKKLI